MLRLAPLLAVTGLAISLQPAWAEFKIGLVLDRGGKDDKSFNSSAYEGATRAKTKLGILLKYVEASDDNAFEPMLRAVCAARLRPDHRRLVLPRRRRSRRSRHSSPTGSLPLWIRR